MYNMVLLAQRRSKRLTRETRARKIAHASAHAYASSIIDTLVFTGSDQLVLTAACNCRSAMTGMISGKMPS